MGSNKQLCMYVWPFKFTLFEVYLFNWSSQAISRDSDLASYATHVVWINLINERLELLVKIGFELQIFEKHFIAILFIAKVFSRIPLRGNRQKKYIVTQMETS